MQFWFNFGVKKMSDIIDEWILLFSYAKAEYVQNIVFKTIFEF